MRRTHIISAAVLLSALALTGCSAGGSDTASEPQSGGGQAPAFDSGVVADEAAASDVDRQVITTGWVTIVVEDPRDAASEAIHITEAAGGRVDGRSEYAPIDGDKGSATLTLRLPSDDLTETLEKLGELGEVREISLNSSDVTMVTQDLDARITALSASIERLLVLLAGATDTDTLITLETAISDRQAQLESLESERRYYADQVSLSTISLNLVTEADVPVETPDTFLSGLEAGWNAFIGFFAGLLVALGVLLPWLVFAGIITAIVIWIIKRKQARVEAPVVEAPAAPAKK